MFEGATSFNGDISNWNTGSLVASSFAFSGASSFNQNLCAWGPSLTQPSLDVTNMFPASACPATTDPNLTASPVGPLCHYCTSFATKADLEAAIDHWVDVGSPSVGTIQLMQVLATLLQ